MNFGRTHQAMMPLLLPLLLLTTACEGQTFFKFQRTPSQDVDSCRMFVYTSSNPIIARFLQEHLTARPCPTGTVVNSAGYCVKPEDSDRCQPENFFADPNYIIKRCAENPTLRFADPFSCANYYDCSESLTSIGCPIGSLYNDVTKKCESFNKVQCNEREIDFNPENIEVICGRYPDMIMTDSITCNRFYNCSKETYMYSVFPPYHDECPYLQLWDAKAMKCLPYDKVQCNTRREIKYPCELFQFQCPVAHCRPCFVDYPDCTNLPDGDHAITVQVYSPRFGTCGQGRVLSTGFCTSLDLGRGLTEFRLFDARSNTCNPISNIPRSLGGNLEEESSA